MAEKTFLSHGSLINSDIHDEVVDKSKGYYSRTRIIHSEGIMIEIETWSTGYIVAKDAN